jgi:pantetheine-phosphate adenylyltransferase
VKLGEAAPQGSKTVIFPGSFDPLTNGHCDIIHRALSIFEKVIVGVLSNPTKEPLFSAEERVRLIRDEFAHYGPRVAVETFSGLLADFAAAKDVHLIVRGLRAVSDYDYEFQLALMNRSLRGNIETLFLVTREENSFVSSSLVRQVASMGGDVSRCVCPRVAAALKKKFKR